VISAGSNPASRDGREAKLSPYTEISVIPRQEERDLSIIDELFIAAVCAIL
jgi:hypothetical protein